jgi:hypothetical protein
MAYVSIRSLSQQQTVYRFRDWRRKRLSTPDAASSFSMEIAGVQLNALPSLHRFTSLVPKLLLQIIAVTVEMRGIPRKKD